MVFHRVVLSWTIDKNNQLKFEMAVIYSQWMEKYTWYNTTICTNLNGQRFIDCFKIGLKDRYALMCDVYAYEKYHV